MAFPLLVPYLRPSSNGLFDDEGRPLLESRVPPELRPGVPMEMKTCPYSGVRAQRPMPMNVSALRQTARHLPEALRGIALLRSLLFGSKKRLNAFELWRLNNAGAALPFFLFHKTGVIPALAAVIAKVSFGLDLVTRAFAFDAFIDESSPLFPTTRDLLQRAELGPLVSPNEVCAATPAMLQSTFEALLVGDAPDPQQGELARLLSPVEPFLLFQHQSAQSEVARASFGILTSIASFHLEGPSSSGNAGRPDVLWNFGQALAQLPPASATDDIACLRQLLPPGADLSARLDAMEGDLRRDFSAPASELRAWLAGRSAASPARLEGLLCFAEQHRRFLALIEALHLPLWESLGKPPPASPLQRHELPAKRDPLHGFEQASGLRVSLSSREVFIEAGGDRWPLLADQRS